MALSPSSGAKSEIETLLDYYPYGKVLREYHIDGNERYMTTQHERDQETQLDYRGARFYDGDVGRFLSLDPLAADYPSLSDYVYVANNPLLFIDPDGKQITDYGLNENGEIIQIGEENAEPDRLFKIDSKGEKIDLDGDGSLSEDMDFIAINDKSLLPSLVQFSTSKEGYGMHSGYTSNRSDVFKVFLFSANNTNVEWALHGFNREDGTQWFNISTFKVNYAAPGTFSLGENIDQEFVDIHSHSRFDGKLGPSKGDTNSYFRLKENSGSSAYHGQYDKENQSFYMYNSQSYYIRKIGDDYRRFNFGGF